jgi:hypothetical protein
MTQSAYQVQFIGVFSKIKITPIRRAKAERKCRFFAWTLLHKKILTTNNLLKRAGLTTPSASSATVTRKLQFIYAKIVCLQRRFGQF